MNLNSLMKSLKKSKLYGNNSSYGKEFDDIDVCSERNGLAFPKSIIIRSGGVIDKIEFVYDTLCLAHGGGGGSQEEFQLMNDEYIVKVIISCKYFDNEDLINALVFTTNKGRTYKVGALTDNRFEYQAEDGYGVCTLFGRSKDYVANLGFYSRKFNLLD